MDAGMKNPWMRRLDRRVVPRHPAPAHQVDLGVGVADCLPVVHQTLGSDQDRRHGLGQAGHVVGGERHVPDGGFGNHARHVGGGCGPRHAPDRRAVDGGGRRGVRRLRPGVAAVDVDCPARGRCSYRAGVVPGVGGIS